MNNNLIKLTTEKMFSPAVFTCSISPPRHSIFCLLQRTKQLTKPVLRCLYHLSHPSSALITNGFTITWLLGFIILQLSLGEQTNKQNASVVQEVESEFSRERHLPATWKIILFNHSPNPLQICEVLYFPPASSRPWVADMNQPYQSYTENTL